jgi:uncharacterized membrane protein SpoIIM required for sporulation
MRSLSSDDLEEMARLHQLVASDLARARRDFPGDRVVAYLNRLVSASYSAVYSTAGISWKDVGRWYAGGFPRLFRATAGYYLLALLLFFGPAILSFAAVAANQSTARVILPAETYQFVTDYGERGKLWVEEIESQKSPLLASTIMTNNIQVAILAFAGGMLLGLGTLYVLLSNGLYLGAMFGVLLHYDGLAGRLLSFVSGHGVIELSVICLAGGAGLMLGDAILRPGMLTRAEALRLAGLRSVQLLLGGASLLVVAGTIEGFLSPSAAPPWVKIATGAVTGVLLYGYWLFVGRGNEREESAATSS